MSIRRFIFVFSAACLFSLSAYANANTDNTLSGALDRLDRTIRLKPEIAAMKEQHIAEMKAQLSQNLGSDDLYRIYDGLFDEYYKYHLDSAIVYAGKKMACARKSGNMHNTYDGIFDIVERYVLSGMYYSAVNVLSQADSSAPMTLWERHRYYLAQQSIYEGMAETASDPALRTAYGDKSRYYRKRRIEEAEPGWSTYVYARAEAFMDEGNYAEALKVLEAKLNSTDIPGNEQAILHFLLATCHRRAGNRADAMLHYAVSANYDLLAPVKEYRSLCILASLLYEDGDINRAYRYISCAFEDAVSCNSRVSLGIIEESMPVITSAYETLVKSRTRKMIVLIIALVVSLVALLSIMVILSRNRKELRMVNEQLHGYIVRLQDANAIKDNYLGRYMDMVSDNVNSLEQYRSKLRVIAKKRDINEIISALKSDEYIDTKLDEFYDKFDATFLGLYPDFVQELNKLLKPDKQLTVSRPSSLLSTELRVFALIRLGVTDSDKIARFLRKSVSTIYNYRVKVRNAALEDRDNFEKRVMEIGKPV